MKFLLLFLLISTAHATNITSGQVFLDETPVGDGEFSSNNDVQDASFQAPGYSFTQVHGADFFNDTPHTPYYCGVFGGNTCTFERISEGIFVWFAPNIDGFVNGIEGLDGQVQFGSLTFVSSFTSDGFTVTGLARAEGALVPCVFDEQFRCLDSGPEFSFNPQQRWNYSAHFGHFGLEADSYVLNTMTITSAPVPELDTLLLTLAGFTGILTGWRRKWFPPYL